MAEERKTEFAGSGVIKKCPNCGAQIEAFQVRCPACGFEIRGEEEGGSAALKNFLSKYKNKGKNAHADMVKTFPLPNTVEDIIEFTLFASQQIKAISRKSEIDDTDIDICAAWSAKLEEARIRAGLSFSKDDPRAENFKTLIDDSVKDVGLVNKLSAKQKRKNKIKKMMWIIIPLFIMVGIPLLGIGIGEGWTNRTFALETKRLEKLMAEIQDDIAAGNYSEAEVKIADVRWGHTYDTGWLAGDTDKRHRAEAIAWNNKQQMLKKQLEEAKRSGK